MNTTKKNIYFFFPYRGIGGVSIIFMRAAHYLAKLNTFTVFLIDYPDGYMARNSVAEDNLYFIEYYHDKVIKFDGDSIIIFQSLPLWGMPENLIFSATTKILFWNLHPYNIFGYATRLNRIRNQILKYSAIQIFRKFIYSNERKALKLFNTNNAIAFMDGENLTQAERLLDLKIKNPQFVPIMIDDYDNIKIDYQLNEQKLNFVWIGRIADFKVHILVYTIRKILEYAKSKGLEISFHIVGNGNYLEYLKNSFTGNSSIFYYDYVAPTELKRFLNDKDIALGMGTSALDMAKYGLPTILLDFVYEEFHDDYLFNWLFETKNYTVGRQIDASMLKNDNDSLETMLDYVRLNYHQLSQKTFNYIIENFELAISMEKLINVIQNNTMEYKDIPSNYFEMNIFHKLIGAKRYYND